jgi:NADH-quinone oxidoreductase subunit H
MHVPFITSTFPLADVNFAESTLVQVVKAILIFAIVFGVVPVLTVVERKLIGRFQSRYGPNRVGPVGLLQPLADALKLLSKEQFAPRTSVPWLMAIAPMITIISAVAVLALIPFGDVRRDGIFGADYGLYGIDVSIGLLYFLLFGSLAFYAFLLAGWSSGSKYSFLGSMRAAAQLISYEVSIGLSLLGVVMTAGSLSLVDIVNRQDTIWFAVPQFVGFVTFLAAAFAETARAPFDLPEADAELVAGFNTEYGGMRFGSFLLAEYVELVGVAGVAVAVFLGGWHGPGPAALDPLWVVVKMGLVLFFFVWVRVTVPRLRYDQLMSLGWKFLLPIATLNALVTAVVVAL